MVARERLNALVLVTLLVASSLLIAVPTASAGHALTNVQVWVETNKDNVHRSNATLTTITAGTTVFINGTATSTGCTGTGVPTITASANIARFNPTAVTGTYDPGTGETTVPTVGGAITAGTPFKLNAVFTVGPRATGTADVLADKITLVVNANCAAEIPNNAQQSSQQTTSSWTLDNTLPVATMTITNAASGTLGIGGTFDVQFGGVTDVATWAVDASQLNTEGTAGTPKVRSTVSFVGGKTNVISNADTALNGRTIAGFTVQETGHANAENPVVLLTLTDANGNTNTISSATAAPNKFDAARPTLASIAAAAKQGGSVEITPATPVDVAKYVLTFTPDGGTALTPKDCSAAQAAPNCFIAGGLVNTSAAFTLATHKQHTASLQPVDEAGNTGTAQTTTFTTRPDLSGLAIRLAVTSGNGGVGSVVTATPRQNDAAVKADVGAMTLDATQAGGGTLAWSAAELAAGTAKTFTVGSSAGGVNAPAFTATATGAAPHGTDATAPLVKGATTDAPPSLDAQAPQALGAQFTASDNGRVRVQVTPPATPDTDLTRYNLSIKNAVTGVEVCTSVSCRVTIGNDFTADRTIFGCTSATDTSCLEKAYDLRIRAEDTLNQGPYSTTGTVTPSLNPIAVAFDLATPTAGRTIPEFKGTYVSGDAGAPTIRLALKKGANFWDGAGAYGATETFHTVASGDIDLSAKTWKLTFPGNPTADADTTDGAYSIVAKITNANNVAGPDVTRTYTLDRAAPTLVSNENNTVASGQGVSMQGLGQYSVILGLNEVGAGIDRIEFRLLDPATHKHVNITSNGVTTQALAICRTVATANCTLSRALVNGYSWDALAVVPYANFTFPGARIGTYELNMTVFDLAGNHITEYVRTTGATRTAQTVTVVPRVKINATEVWPHAYGDKTVGVTALAAFDAASSFDPANPSCPSEACRVTQVKFEVRSGTGNPQDFGTITLPTSTTPKGLDPSKPTLFYYNYTPDTSRTLPFTDISNVEIRAKAGVRLVQNGPLVEATSEWVRLRTDNVLGGLVIANPKENASYAYDPATVYGPDTPSKPAIRTIGFNVSYEESGLASNAAITIDYEVRNNVTGALVNFNTSTTPPTVPISTHPSSTNRYYFNWSNTEALPRGTYVLFGNLTSPTSKYAFQRNFSVETSLPTAKLNDTVGANPEIFTGGYTAGVFNVSFIVDHGYARVNSTTHSLNLSLRNQTKYFANPTEWSYSLQSFTPIDAQRTAVNYTVRLPTSLADGARTDLRINVTTEAYRKCICVQDARANGTFDTLLTFDSAPGNGTVLVQTTRDANQVRTTPLSIWGYAQDAGSGVREVQVRLINASRPGNATYNLTTNTWVAGVQDMWLSSLRQPITDIQYTTPVVITYPPGGRVGNAPDVVTFELGNTQLNLSTVNGGDWGFDRPPMPLDRASVYRVDVRVVDNVSRTGPVSFANISFDSTPPVLDVASLIGPSPPFTGWHGPGFVRIFASDNNCLARVSLVGRSPSNATVGPEDFERPSGSFCSDATGSSNHAWTLNLSLHPNLTSEIGKYEFWVEAADPAGNLVNSSPRTINITVNDTLPAVVRNVTFDPNPAPAGTASKVRIDVFENHQLDHVEVDMLAANGTVIGSATVPAQGGNGTGIYVVETGTGSTGTPGLGVALETGTYTVRARALDAASLACSATACPYVSATLTVVAEGAPQILLDQPATNGSYVNATPTIKFRVLSAGILSANVTVLAGTNASSLSAVNATFTTISGGAGAGGLNGAYSHSGLVAGQNLTVRVTATKSGIPTSAEWTFRVDATAPNATLETSGTTPLAGRNYTTSATKVYINSTDDVGLTTTTYTTSNGVTTSAPLTYTSAITPNPAATDTVWKLEYTVSDAAGNAVRGNLTLHVDKLGPAISVAKHGDELVFTATDAGVGIDGAVTVHYSYAPTGAFEDLEAELLTGNSYEARLPGNASLTGLRYYFTVKDKLGNAGGFANHTALNPYVIGKIVDPETNAPPTVRITFPAPGAVLRDAVDLQWNATDPDGDALTFSVAMRQPREEVLATGLTERAYRHVINASDAGVWTIVVTASDGVNSASHTVTFTVPAGETIRIVSNPPVTASPGQQVPFSVAIVSAGKTVAQANYRVVDSTGKAITSGSMTQSRAGVYSGTAKVGASGDYRVLVDVIYADGSQEPAKDLGAFSVTGGNQPIVEKTPITVNLIMLLGLITIGLAAFGAFGRWRK